MSSQLPSRELSSSRDCPIVDGKRTIQHVSPRGAEVGGIPIHRALPSRQRRLIGAWCFLDHAGPTIFRGEARGMQVGPHPHTCLQTFTWMIEGEVLHRDSLGSEQVIRPGQVNLMTAGYGISHTEQSVEGSDHLHAAQLWIALPRAERHTKPRFDHYPDLPRWRQGNIELTLLTGEFDGRRAPTLAFMPLVGVDLAAKEAAEVTLPLRPDFEYGVMPLTSTVGIEGEVFGADELAYLGRGRESVALTLAAGARVILIGGEPLEDEILMWWNFVGYSKAEIAEAQAAWEAGDDRFGDIPAWQGERLMPPPLPWKIHD